MKNSKPMISVRGLEARYGEKVILSDIDLDIFPGQLTVILGSSGCGKTTMLKAITRLVEPTKGSIKYWGEEITQMDENHFQKVLKQVGMLFQGGALLNSLNVFENIAIPLEQHTHLFPALIERIIRVKLSLVKLGDVMHLMPSELSGGMKKRVTLARAIVLDPKILFCDEPSAGIDPLTSSHLDELLLELKRKLNMTIVVVTHELASIHRIADRIIFLENGRLIFQGDLASAKQAHVPSIDTFFRSGRYD
ncbi:MAG TPA: ATP-binding cassette domain-containing protein [Candidatus Cloacimonadota bacterium]|nr:ATP-binding cassette domain-containing protein [Candidatus Cloacimonadota bacterium]